MLLSLSTTQAPATDLGYLLHKHPQRPQSFELSFGKAHIFYPEASEARCEACLLMEIEPVSLVRRVRRQEHAPLRQYVNDRPYVASSFLAVAMAEVFKTAMGGRCKQRPELVTQALPLRAEVSAVPAPSERILHELFEPLGYTVHCTAHPLDEAHPGWAPRTFGLVLEGQVRLKDLLEHLYVLLPALDANKHYFVGEDEVRKLLERGGDWLAAHPRRQFITSRYLQRRRKLINTALDALRDHDDAQGDADAPQEAADDPAEVALEKPMTLHQRRLGLVVEALRTLGVRSVLDLGCGEGRLMELLLAEPQIERAVGCDVSVRCLEQAARRLRLDHMHEHQRQRVALFQGSALYHDRRFAGFDAVALVEVIEHLDAHRLSALEQVVFGKARPQHVVLTTPNQEYNALFESLPAGQMRHRDHRFEWTRQELLQWAEPLAERWGYRMDWFAIGDEDPQHGPPSQGIVFGKEDRDTQEVSP